MVMIVESNMQEDFLIILFWEYFINNILTKVKIILTP